jgi:hypothetical protein
MSGCESYAGSAAAAEDLETVRDKGFSCLRDIGHGDDAAKLAAMFDEKAATRRVKIRCVVDGTRPYVGASTIPGDADHPSFVLVASHERKVWSSNRGRGILLHEMLHWLGYRHETGFDVPYLAEACCFPAGYDRDNLDHAKNPACRMLRERPAFPSEAYFHAFARVAKKMQIPDEIVVGAAQRQARLTHDGALLMAVVGELYGPRFEPETGRKLADEALALAKPGDAARLEAMRKDAEL